MSTTAVVIIVVVAVIVVAAVVGAVVIANARRRALARQFGPEWDRTVDARGGKKAAASDLKERTERRRGLDIQPLSASARDGYQQEWRQIQSEFVDQPVASLSLADGLVARVMHDSGYPMEQFDSNADLISVDHPEVVENYRHGHQIFVQAQANQVSTEQARDAFISYRSLFTELLDGDSREALTQPTD
jgi:hypothetical protein